MDSLPPKTLVKKTALAFKLNKSQTNITVGIETSTWEFFSWVPCAFLAQPILSSLWICVVAPSVPTLDYDEDLNQTVAQNSSTVRKIYSLC